MFIAVSLSVDRSSRGKGVPRWSRTGHGLDSGVDCRNVGSTGAAALFDCGDHPGWRPTLHSPKATRESNLISIVRTNIAAAILCVAFCSLRSVLPNPNPNPNPIPILNRSSGLSRLVDRRLSQRAADVLTPSRGQPVKDKQVGGVEQLGQCRRVAQY